MPTADTSAIAANLTPVTRLRASSSQRLTHPGTSPFTAPQSVGGNPQPASSPSLTDPLLGAAGDLPPEAKSIALRLYRDRIARANDLEAIQHQEARRQAIRANRQAREADRASDAPTPLVRPDKIRRARVTAASAPDPAQLTSGTVAMSPESRRAYNKNAGPSTQVSDPSWVNTPDPLDAQVASGETLMSPESRAAYNRLKGL